MKIPAILLFLLLFAAPLAADIGQDKRACNNSDLTYSERMDLCTALSEADALTAGEMAWVYRQIGNLHRWQSDFEEAIVAYTESIGYEATNDLVFQSRGISYSGTGQDDLAEADYTKAIGLDPHNDHNYFLRGRLYCRQHRYPEGLADYKRSLELRPRSRQVYVARAGLYEDMGELELVVLDYNGVIEMYPYGAESYGDRGKAHSQLGNTREAIHDLAIAVSLDPNLQGRKETLAGLIPAAPAPPSGSAAYTPPQVGRVFEYLFTVRKYVPPQDDMTEAIMGLAAWFTGPPEDPTPTRRTFIDREVVSVDGVTPVISPRATLAWDNIDAPEGFTPGYYRSMWATTVPMFEGAFLEVELDHAAIDSLWPLAPGNRATGVSNQIFVCPAEIDQMLTFLGCQSEGQRVSMGKVTWATEVVGWEQVVVPAGAFMALVIRSMEANE
ncbi:tetratricopeptide repeat protein, partial [bacterium]|nr:tetratricopeptide repeat protein [bacterium]